MGHARAFESMLSFFMEKQLLAGTEVVTRNTESVSRLFNLQNSECLGIGYVLNTNRLLST